MLHSSSKFTEKLRKHEALITSEISSNFPGKVSHGTKTHESGNTYLHALIYVPVSIMRLLNRSYTTCIPARRQAKHDAFIEFSGDEAFIVAKCTQRH